MNNSEIHRICEQHLGVKPIKIIKKAIGICNEVYELVFDDKSLILRMNQEKELVFGSQNSNSTKEINWNRLNSKKEKMLKLYRYVCPQPFHQSK